MPAVVKANTRASVATDPLRGFRFQVNIQHNSGRGMMASRLGFTTVSGLNIETETMAYREGGMNTTTQKMPGQSNFSPLTLARGMMPGINDSSLWIKEIFDVIQGRGTGLLTSSGGGRNFRCDIDIYLLAHPYTGSNKVPIKARWKVYNAWPASIAYGDLDAGGNAIVMEQMVLQHEGWDVSYAADAYGNTEAPAIAA